MYNKYSRLTEIHRQHHHWPMAPPDDANRLAPYCGSCGRRRSGETASTRCSTYKPPPSSCVRPHVATVRHRPPLPPAGELPPPLVPVTHRPIKAPLASTWAPTPTHGLASLRISPKSEPQRRRRRCHAAGHRRAPLRLNHWRQSIPRELNRASPSLVCVLRPYTVADELAAAVGARLWMSRA
jgi:hypothetical protein